MTTPWHKNPCPGGNGIYNFDRIFLEFHYHTLFLSASCPIVERIFQEIHIFYTFKPKITSTIPPWIGVGVEVGFLKITTYCLLTP